MRERACEVHSCVHMRTRVCEGGRRGVRACVRACDDMGAFLPGYLESFGRAECVEFAGCVGYMGCVVCAGSWEGACTRVVHMCKQDFV